MNLFCQSLSGFTNIYEVSIAVFGHLWRSFHHFVSYSKGLCLMKFNTLHPVASLTKVCIFLKSSALLKAISTYYTTLLSSRIRSSCKYVTPFVLVPNKQRIRMEEGNKFFWLSPWCIFGLCIALTCNKCITL